MSNNMRVAVIGCGVFGAQAALRLSTEGHRVTIFDRSNDILCGASFNNQNRLHLGFHYPRNVETAQQCIRGFQEFKKVFAPCIRGGFPNIYLIADEGSQTTPDEFLKFCLELGVNFKEISLDSLPVAVKGAGMPILCEEVVYDCSILREVLKSRIKQHRISLQLGSDVTSIQREGEQFTLDLGNERWHDPFDAVINCTYADIARLNQSMGLPLIDNQYEYTSVLVISLKISPVGITIMDGPFMTLLPFGRSNEFLLYHVEHAVIEKINAKQMPSSWRDLETAPLACVDQDIFRRRYITACEKFVPAMGGAVVTDVLQGPRMVLAKCDHTDERPSIVQSPEHGYFSIFSGKIDHCIWVADELAKLVADL